MEDSKKLPEISGAGGGGGGNQNPVATSNQSTEVANNLFSVAFAKTVYALSEGEIEGFPNSITKDTYLDNTPIQNVDGTYNFEGYTVDSRTGTDETQTPITGFSATENAVGVSTAVTVATGAITRTITDLDTERARVIINHPALQATNQSNGDIGQTSVSYKIEVSANGGAYSTVAAPTVTGKSNSQFQRAYEFDLSGTGPWAIRVTRLTPDSTTAYLQNSIVWQSYVEIIDEKFAYPNTALLALKVDARQFNSIPDVSVKLRGKRVQVPTNYNPTTRTYTGIWDGTFTTAWTDNPAWIFRDIVVNDRFGVARYVSNISIDPWYLYTISQYCDELVDNGNGGTEPRFTCNVYLQNAGGVYEVLNGLASCFRGLIYYSQGQLFLTQDREQNPVQQFSEANVIQEVDDSGQVTSPCFTYSGTARAARKSVVLANWDDPNQNYSSVTEYQQDDTLLETFGYNPIDLRLLGVTSRGQALRAAKHTLFSNRYLTEKVSFRIGAEGLAAGVGEVIQIADPLKQGQRLGGRIKAISGNNIKLDAVLSLNPAIDYTLTLVVPDGESVTNPDGSITRRPKLSVHNLVSSSEDLSGAELRSLSTQTITDVLLTQSGDIIEGVTSGIDNLGTTTAVVDGNVDTQVNALWVLEWADLQAALYKIVAITEVDPLVFQVEAVQYNASKFDYVDNDLPIAIPKDRFTVEPPQKISTISAKLIYTNGRTQISADWESPQRNNADDLLVRGYRYQWRKAGATQWNDIQNTAVTNATISLPEHVYSSSYEFRVATFDRLGRQSEFTTVSVSDFDAIPNIGDAAYGATVTHANQPDGTQLLIINPGTCPILPRITGFKCWAKPRNLLGGEIPGVKTPGNDGYYFLADIPLTGYYTIAFHAPDTYDVRISFTSAIFGEEPSDYIYDVVNRAEIAPPTPSNFSVVENANRTSKRFSWQLPLSEYGSWDQKVVSDINGYEVRFKRGTLSTNIVEFDVATDIVRVKTSTVIGIKNNQHLLTVGEEIVFAASSGTLPTGITSGVTYYVAADGFNSTEFKVAATAGGSPINLTGTATGTYNISGPADLKTRLDLSATWGAGIELTSGGLSAQQQWFETSLFDTDEWVVMVKSVDQTAWRSDLPAFVLVNIGAPPINNAVATVDARNQGGTDTWVGNYNNCEVSGGVLVQTDAGRDSIFTWNFDNNDLESNLLLSTTATATYQHKLVALTGADMVLVQDPDGVNTDDQLLQEDTPVVIDVASSSFQLQRNGTTIPHLLVVNDTLEFIEVSGSLPTGISTGTTYHVVATDLTSTVFRVAATQGGTAITLSGSATGTYTVNGDAFGMLAEQRFYTNTELAEGGIVHPYAPYERLLGDVYRVETTFKSPDGITAGTITALTAELDYPDVIETINDASISGSAGGSAISLSKTFRAITSVQVTLQNTTALTAVVLSKSTTSITVECRDSAGSAVAGTVDLVVVGY